MIHLPPLRASALAVATVVLAGCSFIPPQERPPLPVAPAFPGQTDAVPAAEVRWQDFVADARLREVIGLALANNRDLRVATPGSKFAVPAARLGLMIDQVSLLALFPH